MISDKWLKELVKDSPRHGLPLMTDSTVREMASELLSLREQKRKLVVDSERLADEIRDKLYPDNDGNVELVLHESLMKELDESIA